MVRTGIRWIRWPAIARTTPGKAGADSPSGRRDTMRLVAFSDGVFAITITLLVLEIRPPSDDRHLLHGLVTLWPSYLAYALTFLFIGQVWANYHVISGVALKHQAKPWKLVDNAFPATLHPGDCLAVVITYHAIERYARVRELVITSDDPNAPVRDLDPLAHTVWPEQCCDDCAKGCCEERRRCEPSCCGCERYRDEDNDEDGEG